VAALLVQPEVEYEKDHSVDNNREPGGRLIVGSRSTIEAEAHRLPQQNYGYETGQFQRMKQVIAGIHEPKPKVQAQ
jgi:hypothetical protein